MSGQAAVGAGADLHGDRVLEGGGIDQQDQLHQGVVTAAGRVALPVATRGELPTENFIIVNSSQLFVEDLDCN